MKIIDFYASDNKDHWLSEIQKSEWGAGKYLYELLRDQKLKELCGEWAKVLLLIDGDKLISFCTYAEQDDVREPSLTPWVGFVYTFPEYRGKRRVGKLLEYVYMLAKNDRHKHIYISTGETGLYEKYGYQFWKIMKDVGGDDSRVYRTDIVSVDYSDVLGTTVSGTIDRPLETYTGKVIAVYHRLNDNEDKWIVSLSGETIQTEDILEAISFQEQYFMGELYTL